MISQSATDARFRPDWRVLTAGRLQPVVRRQTYPEHQPGAEEPLAEVPDCDHRDVDRAASSALLTAGTWTATPVRGEPKPSASWLP